MSPSTGITFGIDLACHPTGGKGSSPQQPEFFGHLFLLEFPASLIDADNSQVVSRTHFFNSLPNRTGDQGLNPKHQFANPKLYRNTKFKCSKRDVEERVFGIWFFEFGIYSLRFHLDGHLDFHRSIVGEFILIKSGPCMSSFFRAKDFYQKVRSSVQNPWCFLKSGGGVNITD